MKVRDATVKELIESLSKIDTSLMSSPVGDYTLSEIWMSLNMVSRDKQNSSVLEFIEYNNLHIPEEYLDMELK